MDLRQHQFLGIMAYLALWLLLCTFLAFTLWQLHVGILSIGTLIINDPAIRPTGWSNASLVGISKLSAFSLISLLMITTMYLEYRLRQARDEGALIARTVRYGLFTLGVLVFSMIVQWLPA